MPRIQVDPEQLQEMGATTLRVGETLHTWTSELAQALSALQWEVHRRDYVEELWQNALACAAGLSDQAGALGGFLVDKGHRFAEADAGLAQGIGRPLVGDTPPHRLGGQIPVDAGGVDARPGAASRPPVRDAAAAVDAPPAAAPARPVITALPGHGVPLTACQNRGIPVDAPLRCTVEQRAGSSAQARRATYADVLAQFDVTGNPRYLPDDRATYCNIFVTDATRAMGAEIPHWVRDDGTPAAPGAAGAHELLADQTVEWLVKHGTEYGWRPITAAEAQARANDGRPTVAVSATPGEAGHVAMVRPGTFHPTTGPRLTNVGAYNREDTSVAEQFGRREVLYFTHA